MRVAFMTCHLPYPPVSGGRRRELELLVRIAKRAEVDLVCVSKTVAEDEANIPALTQHCRSIRVFPASLDTPSLFSRTSWHELRHRAAGVKEHLAALDPDIIHVEGFYLYQHVPRHVSVPVFLTEQNIEYELFQQRNERRRARVTRRAEIRSWKAVDGLGAVTGEDAGVIGALSGRPVTVVPDGIDLPERHDGPTEIEPLSILYVGNFDYHPNQDGARWMLRDVMPRVWEVIPQAKLLLVGNAGERHLSQTDHRVTVTGRVPDLAGYYRSAAVVACPLRVGGGIKVKMLEAIAYGKAIVSTTVGLQGLGSASEEAIEPCDDPAAFAERLVVLLQDEQARAATEKAVIALQEDLPTWDDAAETLLACYHQLLGRSPVPDRRSAPAP